MRLETVTAGASGCGGAGERRIRLRWHRGWLGALAGVLWLAMTSVAPGQPATPQFVRFTVFGPRPIADLAYLPRPNAEPQKLRFYPTARSPRYEYRGGMPLQFIDAASGEVVAEAQIPVTITDALLLLLPAAGTDGAGEGLRYRVAVMDDAATRHGPGGLAIVNLSGLALSGTVNGAAVSLQAGLNPTIAVDRSARVMLRTTFKGRSYQSYADTVMLTAGQRALLLLFPPFYPGSLEVQPRVLLDTPGVGRGR